MSLSRPQTAHSNLGRHKTTGYRSLFEGFNQESQSEVLSPDAVSSSSDAPSHPWLTRHYTEHTDSNSSSPETQSRISPPRDGRPPLLLSPSLPVSLSVKHAHRQGHSQDHSKPPSSRFNSQRFPLPSPFVPPSTPIDLRENSCYEREDRSQDATEDGMHSPPTTPEVLRSVSAPIIMVERTEGRVNAKAWAETVSRELLESLTAKEVNRQNSIQETIQKESEFLADIDLLEELFVRGLEDESSPIPEGPAREAFLVDVFPHHKALAVHIRRLVERLHLRREEQHPIVQSIGDLFLEAARGWGEAYQSNIVNFPFAKRRVEEEVHLNPAFKEFIEACRKHPSAHKHELASFLLRPTTRLQRYHLHFETILKYTENPNEDRDLLTQATELIDSQLNAGQKGLIDSERRVNVLDLAQGVARKSDTVSHDLDLLQPSRKLVHDAKVLGKKDLTSFELASLKAILLDNYLVLVRSRRREGAESETSRQSVFPAPNFTFVGNPIPIELLESRGFDDPPVQESGKELWPFTIQHVSRKTKPLTFYSLSEEAREEWRAKLDETIDERSKAETVSKLIASHVLGFNSYALQIKKKPNKDLWLFSVKHVGRKVGPLLLQPLFKKGRVDWKASLDEAMGIKGIRSTVEEARHIYENQILRSNVTTVSSSSKSREISSSVFPSKITAVVPFTTLDGRKHVAIGCSEGVWVGSPSQPESLRKVLDLKSVSQAAVLESIGLFLVLADKTLTSYSLESLVPSSSSGFHPKPTPQTLNQERALFFSVGSFEGRTLLVYLAHKSDYFNFRILEPVRQDSASRGKGPQRNSMLGRIRTFGKEKEECTFSQNFRVCQTIFIEKAFYGVQFLGAQLFIATADGFEIMDLDTFRTSAYPGISHYSGNHPRLLDLLKRLQGSQPLGIFQSSAEELLLCYRDFAFYMSLDGQPILSKCVIEWSGEVQSVAFQAPYVFGFHSSFVEVRDSTNGIPIFNFKPSDLRYVSQTSTESSSMAFKEDEHNSDTFSVLKITFLESDSPFAPKAGYEKTTSISTFLSPEAHAANEDD